MSLLGVSVAAVITAIAAKGYAFVGWDGDGIAEPGSPTPTVLMTGDRTVTALFVSSEISFVRNTENNTITLLWAGGYGFVLEESAQLSGESGPFVRVATADGAHTVVIDDGVMRRFRFRLRLPAP